MMTSLLRLSLWSKVLNVQIVKESKQKIIGNQSYKEHNGNNCTLPYLDIWKLPYLELPYLDICLLPYLEVRQQVKHKRTFLYVEQVILKHGMFENTLRIGETQHGLDFFYGRPQVHYSSYYSSL